MVGQLIIRGILVGILAGLLAFGFAKIYGEPAVDAGIAFEDQQAEAAGEAPEPEMFSRDVQSNIGLFTGVVVVGAAFGGLFAVLFAFSNGRIGQLGPQQTAVLLAAACFVAIYLVPWLKYPANPPGSNLGETIKYRTAVYFVAIAISIVSMVAAWIGRQRLVSRFGSWNATLVAVAAYVVVNFIAATLLPSINETPATFPATSLWDFRIASLETQLVLWTAIGVVFGAVVERTMVRSGAGALNGSPAQGRRSASA